MDIIRADPLPPPAAVSPAAGDSFTLTNHGMPALRESCWLVLADAAAIASGLADTLAAALAAMTWPAGSYLAGMAQYGVQSSKSADTAIVALPETSVTEPDYPTLCNIIEPYSQSAIPFLVSSLQPRWSGFVYGQEYVAFHSVDRTGHPFVVLVVPPDTSTIGLPNWTPEQVVISAAGHELFETLTDADCGGGWYVDNLGEEGGDLPPCVWHTAAVIGPDDKLYWPQRYWRNDTQGCYQGDELHRIATPDR